MGRTSRRLMLAAAPLLVLGFLRAAAPGAETAAPPRVDNAPAGLIDPRLVVTFRGKAGTRLDARLDVIEGITGGGLHDVLVARSPTIALPLALEKQRAGVTTTAEITPFDAAAGLVEIHVITRIEDLQTITHTTTVSLVRVSPNGLELACQFLGEETVLPKPERCGSGSHRTYKLTRETTQDKSTLRFGVTTQEVSDSTILRGGACAPERSTEFDARETRYELAATGNCSMRP